MKFNDSREAFIQVIKSCDLNGTWNEYENMIQFKAINGGTINLYNNGTLQVQGTLMGKEELESILFPKLQHSSINTISTLELAKDISIESKKNSTVKEKVKVFVVYGHDIAAREQLELILMKLGLDPFVLSNTSGQGFTIIEALEEEIISGKEKCEFGIVLLTPDDIGYSKSNGPDSAEPRARQNVVLEMGMLLSSLGRGNVAILKKGHLEVPSDTQGILYIPFNEHVKETVPKLVDRLNKAGFALKSDAITRASS